jgi:HD-like signal output (HDOD) protein
MNEAVVALKAPPGGTPDLATLACQVRALPPLSDALAEVMVALRREQVPSHRCIQLIERDQALTAATLRLANSAFYGVPGQVHRVADAMRLVGLRSVASVLVASTLQSQLNPDACVGFSFRLYWQHALVSALAARALALRCDAGADAAFLGGLMHNVGQLVLASLLPGPMGQALALAREREMPGEDAERAVLGWSNRPLGALLLQRWHFPEDVLQAVAAEDAPPAGQNDAEARLTRVVQTAGDLARWLLAHPQPGADALPNGLAERCQQLGLPASELPALLVQLREGARALAG